MHTKMHTKGVLLSQSQQLQGIVWRVRRDLNPWLSINISDLTPKSMQTNLILTICYQVKVTISQKRENGGIFLEGV